ncbi:MAG: FadR/GntR family transcriptional regulator [Clostridia bacterium]|nr:FadR/GntR family transcriptional regulator [Clostridia bacterium]
MYDELMENLDYIKVADCKNISDTLFKRFRDLIVMGKLPAGMVLPNENTMSELLGVGRSSLREAYTALALSGFIVRSKSGTYINSSEEMINTAPFNMIVEGSKPSDILEFRFMLEAENASYAAKRATEADINKISESYEKMIENKADIEKFAYYDVEFHMNVAKAAHNELLYNIMKASYSTIRKGVKQAGLNAYSMKWGFMDVVIKVHGDLLRAIKDRDFALAYKVMKDHISYVNATVSYKE